MSSKIRDYAVTAATKFKPNGAKNGHRPKAMDIEHIFGENMFWHREMQARLPSRKTREFYYSQ